MNGMGPEKSFGQIKFKSRLLGPEISRTKRAERVIFSHKDVLWERNNCFLMMLRALFSSGRFCLDSRRPFTRPL